MARFGVEYCLRKWEPTRYDEIQAENLFTAWVLANRIPGRIVTVVFSLDGPCMQASLLDYSTTTGSGDPH